MIYLESINNPSKHVRERSKKMWTKTLNPNAYLVRPKAGGKAKRIVTIAPRENGRVAIECYDKDTGDPCPANRYKLLCAHANAAINRLLTNVKRESNRKHKQQEAAQQEG